MDHSKIIKVRWTADGGASRESLLPTGQDLPLLDLCEEAGIKLPYGCRVGVCGSCRIQVIEGEELLSERTFLEEDTLERHKDAPEIRLACRATIKSQKSESSSVLVFKSAPKVVFED